LSIYANGSINSARTKDTDAQIALTPDRTAALALIYQTNGWTGTLTHKYTGDMYALDNVPYKINGYWMTNASVGYKVPEPGWGLKSLSMNFGVYNLFNEQNIIAVKTASTTGAPLAADTYLFNPGTSVMFSIRGTF
jgi:iron complex outermembrane receptor protein